MFSVTLWILQQQLRWFSVMQPTVFNYVLKNIQKRPQGFYKKGILSLGVKQFLSVKCEDSIKLDLRKANSSERFKFLKQYYC